MGFGFKNLFKKDAKKGEDKRKDSRSKTPSKASKQILTSEEVAELLINEERIERLMANSNHYLRASQILVVGTCVSVSSSTKSGRPSVNFPEGDRTLQLHRGALATLLPRPAREDHTAPPEDGEQDAAEEEAKKGKRGPGSAKPGHFVWKGFHARPRRQGQGADQAGTQKFEEFKGEAGGKNSEF